MYKKVLLGLTAIFILAALFACKMEADAEPTCMVIYHSNFGGAPEDEKTASVIITYGASQTLGGLGTFEHPDGLWLVGWASTDKGSMAYVSGESVPSLTTEATIHLYAKWGYRVIFNTDEGSPEPKRKYVLPDATIPEPDKPDKTNHTFLRWCIQGTDTTWNFTNNTVTQAVINDTVNQTLMLIAKWDVYDALKCYVSFFTYNGDQSASIPIQPVTKGGYAAPPAAPQRTGYTFGYWHREGVTTQFVFASEPVTEQSLILYAQWTPITYYVKFNANYPGESTGHSGDMPNQTFEYDEEKLLSTNAFACTGYDFSGWNNPADGKNYSAEIKVKNLSATNGATVALNATWKKKQCTVRFMNEEMLFDTKTVEYGNMVQAPTTTPTKVYTAGEGLYEGPAIPTSWTFSRWLNGAAEWNFSAGVTGNMDLTADWTDPKKNIDTQTGTYIVDKAIYYVNRNSGIYTLALNGNYTVGPQIIDGNNVDLTIIGINNIQRKISLSATNGSLITIRKGGATGVKLTLGNYITLAGHSGNASNSVVRVETDCTFVMAGSSSIITGNSSATYGGGVHVTAGGIFNLENGTITDNTGGGVYTAGTFNMKGGSISANTASYVDSDYSGARGGGVYVNGGTFTMSGGDIWENKALNEVYGTYAGGGVYVAAGSFTFTGGVISGNEAEDAGGGVCVDIEGNFTLNGGTISNNSAYCGGGVDSSSRNFIMEKGTISYNTADNGGGVYFAHRYSNFIMNGGNIIYNTADEGGGVYTLGGGGTSGGAYTIYFTMNGGNISNNNAERGGGVIVRSCEFTMKGGTISNHAIDGVYITDDRRTFFKMEGGTISSNGGPGIFMEGSTFYMDGGIISNNKGGVYVKNGDFTMTAGEIKNNTTNGNGAGVYNNGQFTMSGGTISGNKTTSKKACGGGVFNSSFFKMTGGTISGNASNIGGGVHIADKDFEYEFDRSSFYMSGGNISGNFAESYPIYPVSEGNGGGVYIGEGAYFEMSNSETGYGIISGNEASHGGGVYFNGGYNYFGLPTEFNKTGGVIEAYASANPDSNVAKERLTGEPQANSGHAIYAQTYIDSIEIIKRQETITAGSTVNLYFNGGTGATNGTAWQYTGE